MNDKDKWNRIIEIYENREARLAKGVKIYYGLLALEIISIVVILLI